MNTVEELFRDFQQLNEIGAALSSERDLDRLLEKILIAAKNITHADAGTLYFMDDSRENLRFAIVINDSQKLAFGGTSGNPVTFPPLPLKTASGTPNNDAVAAYCAIHRVTVNIADAYEAEGFDFSDTRRYDQSSGYRSKSFLTIALTDHDNEVIGVLQLINALDQNGEVTSFSPEAQRLAESLASQAAVAVTNRQLQQQLEDLFESFIGMINMAIDDKSPYTGGHCQRVPTLTMMLADAVAATTEGPFAEFEMSEADRYELKIAGLLHDCGKVTTPVHVVDKATKLQTIYDRIDLIDTRYEVLKRDAEIALLKARLDGDGNAKPTQQVLQQQLTELQEELNAERDFLRRANIGAEFMTPEDQQRVRDIAVQRQWRNPQGETVGFLSADEVENLTIRAGTLTQAEREIINNHIVVTIRMLESLPWARHLARVPEFAGGHHERMDGKGYPRGLTRDQMSVQARVMGIADIFEALTARDRPYKQGKSLTEALDILGKLSLNGHIDPDLFDIFVRQKVYRKFVEMFVDAAQIDQVDERKIPGYAG